jgi:hypothetical protein
VIGATCSRPKTISGDFIGSFGTDMLCIGRDSVT